MGWRRRRRCGSRAEQGVEQGGEPGGESGGKWEEEWWGVEVEFVVCGTEVMGRREWLGEGGSGRFGCLVGGLGAEGAGRGSGVKGLEVGRGGRIIWAFGVRVELHDAWSDWKYLGCIWSFPYAYASKIYSDPLGFIPLESTVCQMPQVTFYPSSPSVYIRTALGTIQRTRITLSVLNLISP